MLGRQVIIKAKVVSREENPRTKETYIKLEILSVRTREKQTAARTVQVEGGEEWGGKGKGFDDGLAGLVDREGGPGHGIEYEAAGGDGELAEAVCSCVHLVLRSGG